MQRIKYQPGDDTLCTEVVRFSQSSTSHVILASVSLCSCSWCCPRWVSSLHWNNLCSMPITKTLCNGKYVHLDHIETSEVSKKVKCYLHTQPRHSNWLDQNDQIIEGAVYIDICAMHYYLEFKNDWWECFSWLVCGLRVPTKWPVLSGDLSKVSTGFVLMYLYGMQK